MSGPEGGSTVHGGRGIVTRMDPLNVRRGFTIPADLLSTAYTRALAPDEDAAEAARKTPSVVELRCEVRRAHGLTPEELERIVSYRPLRADSRGTVRVSCGDFASRVKNLAGARELLRRLLLEALEPPPADDGEPEAPRPKRGPGLRKRS
ncbi:MAG: hypothetical protein KC635_22350 [Myxococcales bacterium]|nr:hypothetical protein [Myxococcales bacterium]MCB9734934.1 hypothetical protein [Deltaproteobacteria bacterium]